MEFDVGAVGTNVDGDRPRRRIGGDRWHIAARQADAKAVPSTEAPVDWLTDDEWLDWLRAKP